MESELNKAKHTLAATDQLKANLVAAELARDASYAATAKAQSEFAATGAQRNKALQDLTELQAVACDLVYERVFNRGISRARDNYDRKVTELRPEIFMEGWLACLTELSIPEDNPTWAKVAPTPELPEPPAPYLLMILPSFDE